jgi:hypothetical protein
MGLPALTQDERLELSFFERRYLVEWGLPTKTLYISDRNYKYEYGASSQDYEDYLFDLSELAVELARVELGSNQRISLRFKNSQILTYDRLIELDAAERFCFSTIKIYELRLIESGETFTSDVKQVVFRGVCGQPYAITRREFRIDVHNVLLAKRNRLPLHVVDTATFPNADPDDLGKIRNTIYGSIDHVPCRGVLTGAIDTLDADITDSATTITISGISKTSFPTGAQTIQIDEEQVTVTSRSGNTFTVNSRGANGTTAQAHKKGAVVAEVLTEYIYEVAKHPVKAINAVCARSTDGRMVLVDSGDYTAYTGKSGDQKSGYGATAVIVFSVLPKLVKQVGIDVSQGSHSHETTGSTTDERYPTGAGGDSGAWVNPGNMIDGDEDTYSRLTGGDNYGDCWVFFNNSGSGTVNWRKVRFMYSSTSPSGNDKVTIGTAAWQSVPPTGGVDVKDTIELTFSGDEWNLTAYFHHDGVYGEFRIHEVYWCQVNYGSGVVAGPATGVLLSGNSVADTVIGSMVTADVDGYEDDASGTYTGTPNALIERWDQQCKHILIELLGESASDIGSSFATSGASYGTTYKPSFILHEIAQEADELLRKISFQCRSKFLEWRGKFELIYLGSAPSPSRTFAEDDCKAEPIFGSTPEIDIRNRIYAHYKRDYRKGGGFEAYDGVETDFDATSISKNGERIERVGLSACRIQAMAQDWVAWFLTQLKQEWRTVEVLVPWIGKILGADNTFSLAWDFWSGITWDLIQADVDPNLENVRLEGQEWPS